MSIKRPQECQVPRFTSRTFLSSDQCSSKIRRAAIFSPAKRHVQPHVVKENVIYQTFIWSFSDAHMPILAVDRDHDSDWSVALQTIYI